MTSLRYVGIELLQTLLRLLPWPCETGLVTIGKPGRDAPVFLTGNFRLTVERVRRALAGLDAYLLVANSRGVNVWCAATGGLLTDHDVVSVLKTSGIADLVDHRQVILPQLAATGIERKAVQRRTGWRVVWGPVRADAIPAFLRRGLEATRAMRTVDFPWPQRLEMAIAWAFPISLLALLLLLPFWREAALPVVGLVWGLSLLIFATFPLYERYLRISGTNVGFVFFDFGRTGLPLVLWCVLMAGLAIVAGMSDRLGWELMLRWGLVSFAVLLILSLDLMGSTPVYKSALHEDRLLRIALDAERCRGAAFCERVCPKDVFEVDPDRRLATLPRPGSCVQCGACLVQCPFDALFFESPGGEVLTPQTVRRFKLNLMGRRLVSADAARAGSPDPRGPRT
jgi:NAD-dependent dihydropyrimidine dehydrogenase PreA subunit